VLRSPWRVWNSVPQRLLAPCSSLANACLLRSLAPLPRRTAMRCPIFYVPQSFVVKPSGNTRVQAQRKIAHYLSRSDRRPVWVWLEQLLRRGGQVLIWWSTDLFPCCVVRNPNACWQSLVGYPPGSTFCMPALRCGFILSHSIGRSPSCNN
jgi:hypothetical protein